ncbi:non-hydrolyzing UDP-N-acetylglucosamine 2-epimerase [Aquipuribacter nitratireducens]|uniref:UDP-N-acetylglucosamine 2-epimerase (non-hydrolyzing) n=1 Tax=Aquipuribacter nitratireducens TaxID=650104 RepID=A0ABW0GHV6_9MICO
MSEPGGAPKRVMLVYGTRPEAIKMAPLVPALREAPGLEPVVAVTGQHREMLDQVNDLFGIVPDHDLNIIQPRQTLVDVTVKALTGLSDVLRADRPDLVVVQGDTTTSTVAALAAAYEQVPVAHVEAGLRTHNRYSPFPEEINRRVTGQLANLHLAPTATSRANLLREGVDPADVAVTGNTVIDALLGVVGRGADLTDPALTWLNDDPRRVLLVTTHRRESWGEPMAAVARGLARIARDFPDLAVVIPLHRNPVVREVVMPAVEGLPNVTVLEPLEYAEFARVMNRAHVVLTDSGGVQEEAPSLGKPVLVMRENTERPEAVEAGTVRLIGTDEDRVVDEVSLLLRDEGAYAAMANAVNPYGDGHAAERSVAAMAQLLGTGSRVADFAPES